MGRSLRTRLDLIHPGIRARVDKKQALNKERYDKLTVSQDLEKGSQVWVRDYRSHTGKWQPGMVTDGAGSLFKVQVGDQEWRRHGEQLRARSSTSTGAVAPATMPLLDLPDTSEVATGNSELLLKPSADEARGSRASPTPTLRRSTRVSTQPQRLSYVDRGKQAEEGKV